MKHNKDGGRTRCRSISWFSTKSDVKIVLYCGIVYDFVSFRNRASIQMSKCFLFRHSSFRALPDLTLVSLRYHARYNTRVKVSVVDDSIDSESDVPVRHLIQ